MKFLDGINRSLDSTFKSIMISSLIQEIFIKGQYICKNGEVGRYMYIIKKGEVESIKKDSVLKQGDNFGQKPLLENAKRFLDVRTKIRC